MFRQPIWVAIAILVALALAIGFLVLRGSCSEGSGSAPQEKTPRVGALTESTPSVARFSANSYNLSAHFGQTPGAHRVTGQIEDHPQ